MGIKQYGLIGYPLTHSFSEKYFAEKFEKEGIEDCRYDNFPIDQIEMLPALISSYENLIGLNVTIPYKQVVSRFLDDLSEEANAIGAVNTIRIEGGRLSGFNTDAFGFEISLGELLGGVSDVQALVLGTGGASKAVTYVLKQKDIDFQLVSRRESEDVLTYSEVTADVLSEFRLIINTTPVGMYPRIEECVDLPFEALTQQHYLYDLIYNPELTTFLQHGKAAGARIKNGLEMLILQAEKSWEIWNQIPAEQ